MVQELLILVEEIVKNIKEGASELEIAISGRDKMEREIAKPIQTQNTWIHEYGFNLGLILTERIIQKQIVN